MLGFADIARLFEQIELRLIASLRRNLSAHRKEEKRLGFQWSAWQAEKLSNLDRFRRQNRQILHEYTDIIDDETRSLMLEQFDEGERLAEEQTGETESVPSSAFFGVNKDKMDSLITDITTLEKTAESAALRMVDDVYRQTLHRVQLEMGSGSMTLEQAVDVAVKDFLDKGINCIQYADGRRVNIADYVRMALRTSATRATLQGQAKRLAELGYDTVATTAYGGCSETCEPWQGRAYIDDVFTPWNGERQLIGGVLHGRSHYCGKWFPLLSEATGSGLFHPNCRHGLTVYIDGRTELPKPIPAAEIKAQREREETQRRMEREIRKLKRFAAGTLDPYSAKAYRRKLREAQQELRLFIEQENATEGRTVLRRKYEREKVYEGEVPKAVEPVKESAPPEVETKPPEAPEPEIKEVPETAPEPPVSDAPVPEGKAVDVTVSEPEKAEEAYTEEPVPQPDNVNNKSVDKSEKSGILESISNQQDFMDRNPREQLSRYVNDPKTGERVLEKWSFRINPMGEYLNIFSQTYSEDARTMAEYLNERVNNGDYGKVDRIVIAKNEDLRGISSYDHTKNTLYISEELITKEGFDRIVDKSYFPVRNLDDVITHELDGHKRHWDIVKKFYNNNLDKYSSLKDAKQDFERPLREYIVKQQSSDYFYVSKIVSENAGKAFIRDDSLNELIADSTVIQHNGEITDELLFDKLKELMKYDAKS